MKPKTLIKLLLDNQSAERSWSIKQEEGAASLYIHDVIGGLYGS